MPPLQPRIPGVLGAVGAVALLGMILLEGATRPGYSPIRHGVSQLTSGESSWPHRTGYVVCGVLILAFAVGLKQSLATGVGRRWGWLLCGFVGAGVVLAGIFPTDPALGYPPGATAEISLSGGLHQVGGTLLFAGLIGGCFTWARRFKTAAHRGWFAYCLASGIIVAVTAFAAGIGYRLATNGTLAAPPIGLLELVAFLAGFGWLAVLALARPDNRRAADTGSRPG